MDPLVKPSVNKLVLSNYIRHADSHNKVQEEREMWRQRGLELRSQHQLGRQRLRSPPLVRGRLVSDTLSPPREEPHSYYWTRQLLKAEENDPFRWGHSGYKELHPEEFISTDSDSEDKKVVHKKRKKEKHKKHKRQRKDESRSHCRGADLTKGLPKEKSRKRRPRDSDSESGQDYAQNQKKHKSQPQDSATESDSECEDNYVLKRRRHRDGRARKTETSRWSATSSEDGKRRKKTKKSRKDLVSS